LTEYAWYPHTGPQTEFCESWQTEVLYGGAAGGGKTDCLIMEGTRYISYPDYHGIILRRTFPMLQEVIDRTRKYYPFLGGEYKSSEHRWYFPGGGKITLGHCQHDGDEYAYQGKEFQFIGIDEAGQFLPKQILYLFSRCRSTNPEIPKRMRYASNPGGPAHQFLKDRFRIGQFPEGRVTFNDDIETELNGKKVAQRITRVFIPAKLADNPSLIENDPNYIAMLMQLPEIERMRLLHGIWDAFEGQVFGELNYELHAIDMKPEDVPLEWTRYRTFDWGRSAPFSVGWWAVDYDDNLYRYREWYGAKKDEVRSAWVGLKMNASDIARGIYDREEEERKNGVKVNPGPADPSIWHKRRDMKTGAIGPSVADEMIGEGIVWIPADNDRILGKQQVHSRFAPDEKDGTPKIFISKDCDHWWRTMPSLTEDPRHPEDVDTTGEDHIYDETRYMCMFRPLRPVQRQKSDAGSFQAERRRYLKAKQFATRYGVGMDDAYRRVR
jgi:hypothetical protein